MKAQPDRQTDSPALEQMFTELELASPAAFLETLLNPDGIHLWRRLHALNLDRALRMASKSLAPSTFAWMAFADLSYDQKRSALKALATGEMSSITHWPVVVAVLNDILERPRSRQRLYSRLVDDLGEAFAKLTQGQQQIVVHRVTAEVAWEPDDRGFCRRYPPGAFEMPAFSLCHFARELKDETVRLALKRTAGQVSFHCFGPQLDELAGVVCALGGQGPLSYFITLDLITEPWRYSDGAQFDCRVTTEAVSPVPILSTEKECLFENAATPSHREPVFDYLSCYCWDSDVGPRIVLRVERVAAFAVCCGIPFEDLFALAWIHAFAHLMHLGVPDPDGRYNAGHSPDFVEMVAQWATWQATQDHAHLRRAFEKLLRRQVDLYHTWDAVKDCSKEEFHAFLWCLRMGRENFDFRPVWARTPLAAPDKKDRP